MNALPRRRRGVDTVTFPELFQLPVTVPLATAARAFHMSAATAYRQVREGRFPCEVIRTGKRYKVPVAALMRKLGVDCIPVHLDDIETGLLLSQAKAKHEHRPPGV